MKGVKKYNRSKEKEIARRQADPICEVVITRNSVIRQSPFIPSIEGAEVEEDKIWEVLYRIYDVS